MLACVSATAMASSVQAGEGGVSVTSPKPPAASGLDQAYPIRGKHEYWDEMGAGRNHQGVDIGSPCGTPLVAAQPGRVRFVKYHSRAGNYAVIDVKNSVNDLVYMHMREAASVRPGQSVGAGQAIGFVGDTGNASGCHLHFEIWEGAYYGGGSPIDPMPYLEAWDRHRKRPH
ncbi:MAG TPA: M23 family metallopeptidase [Solirubrobacterales bacterium]